MIRRLSFNQQRHAFTLVELLVVIAIIGILVSLLLPAVNSAREAARRTQCLNHVRQLGLALINYNDTNQGFPKAFIAGEPYDGDIRREGSQGKHGHSWMVHVLPFMEESALYDGWDFTRNVLGNAVVAQTDITTFYCPSRRSFVREVDRWLMFEQWPSGGNDYGGCIGWGNGFWDDRAGRERFPCSHDTTSEGHVIFGQFTATLCLGRITETNSHGLISPYGPIPLRKVTDGTSKTILVGEVQRVGLTRSEMQARGLRCIHSTHDGWAVGGVSNLFDTNYGGINDGHFEHPGSDHPGGCHLGLADGAVQFYSENVDSCTLRQQATFGGGEVIDG